MERLSSVAQPIRYINRGYYMSAGPRIFVKDKEVVDTILDLVDNDERVVDIIRKTRVRYYKCVLITILGGIIVSSIVSFFVALLFMLFSRLDGNLRYFYSNPICIFLFIVVTGLTIGLSMVYWSNEYRKGLVPADDLKYLNDKLLGKYSSRGYSYYIHSEYYCIVRHEDGIDWL